MHQPTPEEIVTDEEIIKVHANANFGDRSKRQVVNEAVLKIAFGWSNGHTAETIVQEHELAKRYGRGRKRRLMLTYKGVQYFRAVFGGFYEDMKGCLK